MNTLVHVALLTSIAAPLAWSAGTVKVYTSDSEKPTTLTHVKHLLDLVGQPRFANIWWLGAVIAERQKTTEAEQQHKALLARLTRLAEQEGGDDAAVINSVRQQLQALKVTGRQKVNLDPDSVRVTEKGNHTLEGEYTLWLPVKPTTVNVMGLISSPSKMSFTPGRDVASYLDQQSLLSGADNSYAWVIYPDGRRQYVPVAYWNKRHIEPMPGSVIFVGFADHYWTKAYDGLNTDILRSLTQRIPE